MKQYTINIRFVYEKKQQLFDTKTYEIVDLNNDVFYKEINVKEIMYIRIEEKVTVKKEDIPSIIYKHIFDAYSQGQSNKLIDIIVEDCTFSDNCEISEARCSLVFSNLEL